MRSPVMLSTCAALLFCAVPLSTAAAGVVIHVPAEEMTIADGLTAATAGDTVVVACDTYYENGLSMPSGVLLMSSEHYAWKGAVRDTGCVVIDGDGRGVIMTCESITDAEVHDITFTDGSGTTGGAVYCHDADVLFDYCFFTGNYASAAGGGMNWSGGTPTIYACTFNGNTAGDAGGGLAIYETDGHVGGCRFASNHAQWGGGAFANQLTTTTVFTECEFQWNVATEPSLGGGGVYLGPQAGPTFEQCWFNQNQGYYGGAVHNSTKTEPSFVDCVFDANSAVWYGGAVYGYEDNASFDGCEFTFNTSTEGSGGALALDKSDITMDFCILYMNDAVAGGGIFATTDAEMDITSCTIVENTVDRAVGGAGVFVNSTAVATIDQTIIAFNRGGEGLKCDNGGTATLTCSDVSDNAGGDWVGCIAGQESSSGNLEVNPLFCAAAARDFHLCADSACLPSHNDCGELIGAWDEGCTACGSPVERTSWGSIKGMYR